MLIESTCINAQQESATTSGVEKIAQWQLELDQFIASTQFRLEQISAAIASYKASEDRFSADDHLRESLPAQDEQVVESCEEMTGELPTEESAAESTTSTDELESVPPDSAVCSEEPDSAPDLPSPGILTTDSETTTERTSPVDAEPDNGEDDPLARLSAIKRRLAEQLENS